MRHETVKIDCRRKLERDVIRAVTERLGDGERRLVIVLDHLMALEGSVATLLKDLVRTIVGKGVRASVVDASGCAAAFLDALGSAAPVAAMSADSAVPQPKRVLVVEDHDDSLEFLATVIESAGHVSVRARTLAEAVRRLESGTYDLVLLDMVLPDGEGLGVAEHLRGLGQSTPVVVISAYLDRWDEGAYARCQIQKRIAKPYRVKDILEAIRGS
jgi:CheY-like chemotaxis protein